MIKYVFKRKYLKIAIKIRFLKIDLYVVLIQHICRYAVSVAQLLLG